MSAPGIVEFLRARLDEDEREAVAIGYYWWRDSIRAQRTILDRFVAVMADSMFADRLGPSAFRGYDTIQVLAAVYSGHPDYRESWAPRG